MKITSNSLTALLDKEFPSLDMVETFIDDLEDEIFGLSNRDFYLKYKGDIKELLAKEESCLEYQAFERELLSALMAYYNQREKAGHQTFSKDIHTISD